MTSARHACGRDRRCGDEQRHRHCRDFVGCAGDAGQGAGSYGNGCVLRHRRRYRLRCRQRDEDHQPEPGRGGRFADLVPGRGVCTSRKGRCWWRPRATGRGGFVSCCVRWCAGCGGYRPIRSASEFSNYGPEVDLAAPGVDIYSTWTWLDGYFTKSGTSMAVPHVSGVAALVWSRWVEWTDIEVSRRIMETAVDVDASGWDPYTGWGRLDVARPRSEWRSPRRVYLPLVTRG